MLAENHHTSLLDATKLNCPWPIIKTRQVMEKLSIGQQLLVLVEEPSYAIDCRVYLKQSGNSLVTTWVSNNIDHYLLEKTSNQ